MIGRLLVADSDNQIFQFLFILKIHTPAHMKQSLKYVLTDIFCFVFIAKDKFSNIERPRAVFPVDTYKIYILHLL